MTSYAPAPYKASWQPHLLKALTLPKLNIGKAWPEAGFGEVIACIMIIIIMTLDLSSCY